MSPRIKIPDVQNQKDNRNITIDKVGVKSIKYPIVVSDRRNEIQHTVADINFYVELPHSERGTHMSRFVEVLNNYHQEDIINKLDKLLAEIKKSLKADAAYIEISFDYFILKQAPVSKISSYLNYKCFFKASLSKVFDFWIGVKVPVTTLCPCSKEISQYGAHNQRSEVTLSVQYNDFIWLEELIDLIEDSGSSEVYSLLKREDEKYVTEKAYNNPMFVEDIIRELTVKLSQDKRIVHFEIESENFESIHNHNAYAYKRK
ncbi:MAG: GTP cyclohydrolase FolE2 [Candidatus Cloacimonadaceae bacterium]